MELIRFSEAPPYQPAGHAGVVNRLLAGRAAGNVDEVSVWHGAFEPGGSSDSHTHPGSVQIYVGMSGELEVVGVETSVRLKPSDAVVIAAGENHAIRNVADGRSEVLVISSPALR